MPTAPLIVPTRHGLAGPAQALAVAVELERQQRELVAEARGLGDDAVGAPAITVVRCSSARRLVTREQPLEPPEEQVARLAELQRQGRVEQVGRRQPVVDPPARLADRLADDLDERRHVVLRDALELGDALEVERRSLADRRASSSGIAPSRAHASTARTSTSSQCPSCASSDQTAAISGSV